MASGPNKNTKSHRKDDFYNWNLRATRIAAGYTQQELATLAGSSHYTVESYERLLRFPERELAVRIANILGKSVDVLFSEDIKRWTREVNTLSEAGLAGIDVEESEEEYLEEIIEEGPEELRGNMDYFKAETPQPYEEVDKKIVTTRVRRIVGSLSPAQRKCVTLHFGIGCQNHSLTEVGKILGISKYGVWGNIRNALKRIRGERFSKRKDLQFLARCMNPV